MVPPKQITNTPTFECLRCKTPMNYRGSRSFHEGRRFGVLGDLFELLVNKEELHAFHCPNCKKVEFFSN